MRWTDTSLAALCLVLALGSPEALAQETAEPSTETEGDKAEEARTLFFDAVIVTGTAAGQTKFETSYAVTDFAADDLQRLAPLNTADLIGQAPGVYVESTGGEASNVYRVRGIPNEGSFQIFQEDGMPIYPENSGFFFTGDGLLRTDIMTERFEVVRGGPAPVFASNASAIYNSITRQGGEEAEGAARLTLGNTGLYRADAYWAGPVAPRTHVAAGGFYRYHDGYRDNGYPSDEGGQFRVNARREFDNGEIRAFAKYLNEKNTFYLPIPLNNPVTGESLDRYVDFHEGTLNTPALNAATFRYTDASGAVVSEQRALSDGRQTDYINLGLEGEWTFGTWTVSNQLHYIDGQVDFDALYSSQNPATGAAFAAGRLAAASAAFPGTTRLGYAIAGTNGTEVYDPSTDSGLVLASQYRNIQSDWDAIQNDFRVTGDVQVFGRHTLTAGLYVTNFSSTGSWRGQEYLTEVRSQPRLLDLVAYDAAGNVTGYVTDDGVLGYSSTLLAGRSEINEYSLYLTDVWQVTDRLSLEAGVRQVEREGDGAFLVAAPRDLGDPTTLADNAVLGHTGFELPTSLKEDNTAWTLGANYDLTDSVGVYARTSQAYRGASEFNLILPTPSQITAAEQYEVGIKYDTPALSVFATLFQSKFDPFTATLFEVNPQTGETGFISFVGTVESPGVEVDFSWRPLEQFTLDGAITYNDAKLGNFVSATGAQAVSAEGNQPIRQPKWYGNIRPGYTFSVAGWDAEAYARYNFVGDRYVDLTNNTLMPAYETLGLGVTVRRGPWTVQLTGDNVTNAEGITEGNTRSDAVAGQGTPIVNQGRTIFGANYRLVLTRSW